MRIIPAIDLRGGRCVRLQQGDYDRETIFGEDPAAMAGHWQAEGATLLHIVDLDGARDGRPVNVASVRAILDRVSIPCQLGGGIRDDATADTWLDAGVERIIIGTKAVREPDWFRNLSRRHAGRIVLGIDAREGRVAADGWRTDSSQTAPDVASQFDDLPLAAVIYTDISRDGTLAGPNLEATRALATRLKSPVIASGGVGCLEDLIRLAQLPIAGCIVGRALYEGRFRLSDAQRLVDHDTQEVR